MALKTYKIDSLDASCAAIYSHDLNCVQSEMTNTWEPDAARFIASISFEIFDIKAHGEGASGFFLRIN